MKFLCLILIASSLAITATSSSSSSSSSSIHQWEILTKHNFSSQIRIHPHILLLLTVPWSGESRSLMNDLSHSLLINHNQQHFQSLKLMLLYRNTDNIIADSIDSTSDHVKVVYFHHSVSYKYRGRLKAQNILSSLFPYMSLSPEEVPLKSLNTPQDLAVFLNSTDKALVLVDFCGWTPKLLRKTNINGTRSPFLMHGLFSGGNNRMSFSNSRMKINQKVSEESMCKADLSFDKGFCEAPWLGESASVNDGEFTTSCSSEEFERFHSLYLKFMTAVREFFLPPERHSFGLVSDRSMLSSLGVGDSGLWFAVHYIAGCSSCSTILQEEDDLNYVMKMDNYYVKELEGNGHDQEPILPVNRPSVLLFVDRSSDSSETREKSKEALAAFRVLAQHYHVADQTGKKNNKKVYHIQDHRGLKSTSDHPRLNLPVTAQTNKLKEKMSSIVIINGDKQVSLDSVASDLQSSSLKEILGYILQKKKDKKLSSLAKDLGFQLLSDDIDIRSANTQQSQSEVQLNQISTETSQESHTDTVKLEDDPYAYPGELEENPNLTELPYQHNEVKTSSIVTSEEIKPVQPGESVADYELSTAKVIKSETDASSDGSNSSVEKAHLHGFNGSFFYSDGNHRLLERLTGACKLPSLVIVDPLWQQHFVYPEENLFDFSSLNDFIFKFVNGTLLPYQRSDHVILGQREATRPPFVNLDFHEVDSIPRITASTFSELVIGFNLSSKENISNALNKDVLVLFSNSWCAFCQRMEMVVREVYRSIKGYMDMLKNGSRNIKGISEHESLDYVTMKLPLIYLLDCTLNECDLILKSIHQREVYPALVLFPAGKKQPFLYEGDMAVVDVMKFVAEHGNNFHHLIREKVAVLWRSERVVMNPNLYGTLQTDIHDKSLHKHNNYHVAKGHERMLEQMVRPNLMDSPVVSNGMHETLPKVMIGSVLIATEKLVGSQPFDGSKILIVAADHITGFQGLIINKNIEWSFLPDLEEGFENLKKAPLSFGGPVAKSGMPLLSLTRTVSGNSLPEIVPGIYFLNQVQTIQKIEELKADQAIGGDYWFFAGYSSWGWKQLYDEMAEGAWKLSEDGARHLKWPGL